MIDISNKDIEINAQFAKALQLIEKGQSNLLITGKAGTGKSTLLKYYCKKAKRKPVVLAPTGVAALNVNGQTIHNFFRFRIDVTPEKVRTSRRRPKNSNLYKKLTTIIIDEASMVRADLLDCVDEFLKKFGPARKRSFGGVQMIFIGDLYQLPPVVTYDMQEFFRSIYTSPYFFSAHALEGQRLEIVELDKIYRQRDDEFVELLNRIRNESTTPNDIELLNQRVNPEFVPPQGEFYVRLTTTKRNAEKINEQMLLNLPGDLHVSEAIISGEFGKDHYPTAAGLAYKVGAQVMMQNNNEYGQWVNGSVGTIESVEFDDGVPVVFVMIRGDSYSVEVRPHSWELIRFTVEKGVMTTETVGRFKQLPFNLAWAVTIHKSQGKTFDRIIVDFERGAFASGQTYVALSRCTTLEGIVFTRPLKESSVRVDWRVQKFLTGLKYEKAELMTSTESKTDAIRQAISNNCELKITYLKPNDVKDKRVVIPMSVQTESYSGKKFLGMRAYCKLRNDERMFRVDRILEFEVLDSK